MRALAEYRQRVTSGDLKDALEAFSSAPVKRYPSSIALTENPGPSFKASQEEPLR